MADNENMKGASDFTFQRMGGINQAILVNDYDWQNLDKLDPKLWMALSCPIQGLEFNAETLKILDTDNDGRIRAQEVKEAVQWLCTRVIHPAMIKDSKAEVSLKDLRDDTDEGRAMISALDLALKKLDKTETLNLEEIEGVVTEAASYPFNGDGVVPVDSAENAASGDKTYKDIPDFIRMAMSCVGAKKDASGRPGLDADLAKEFVARLQAFRDWREKVEKAELPLGEKTAEAWTLIQKLGPKLDDYFYRCHIAAYAPEALSLLNQESIAQGLLVNQDGNMQMQLDNEALSTLPIARITPEAALTLTDNINPAWRDDAKLFADVFASKLAEKDGAIILEAAKWKEISTKFGEYDALLKTRPTYDLPPEDATHITLPGVPELAEAPANDPLGRAYLPVSPNVALDELDPDQIKSLLQAQNLSLFDKLVQDDLNAPPLAAFVDLRKLALFHGYLYTFLMNFLSFMDFYNPEKKAIFQSGTLYLDSRACTLCVPVADIDAHARLADPSHLCLIYCDCSRKETDGAEKTGCVAAALTGGTLAGLIEGRHGLFIDNDGKEWDTTIARIVHNPVSIKEAVWSPYIRIGNMISEQIQKFAAAKDEAVAKMADNTIGKVAGGAKPEEPKAGFDFAKGAGIFAAVSVAISVLSAAFAYIANSIASLGWWWPLALVLVFICISGPSVFLAWLKLRKRSLGPLLDASGWAVNQGAPINLAMGASLTSEAHLPPNAKCDPNDPYSLPGKILRRKWRNRIWLLIILLLLLAIGCFALYCYLFVEPVWFTRLRALVGM